MMKIRRISDFQRQFAFPNFDAHPTAFLASDLGKNL